MLSSSQRTQIILPKELKKEIDVYARRTGESMAEFLREAARKRLEEERKREANHKKLAGEFLEFVRKNKGKSGWEGIDAVEWQRKSRKEEDEHRTKGGNLPA